MVDVVGGSIGLIILPDNPIGCQAYLDHIRKVFLKDDDSKLFDYEWDVAMKAEKNLLDKNPQALDRPSDLPYAEIMKLDDAHTEQVIQRLINEVGKKDTDLLLDQGAVDWKVELAIKIISTTTASIPQVALRLKTGHPDHLLRIIKKRGQTPTS